MAGKQHLKGSKSRDDFKYWHKQLPIPSWFYASDIDFVLVRRVGRKRPAQIVAILDYKRKGDRVSFAECIAYNDLMQHYPIYIVESEKPFEEFEVSQYKGGDCGPKPPVVKLDLVASLVGIDEWIAWEQEVRYGNKSVGR